MVLVPYTGRIARHRGLLPVVIGSGDRIGGHDPHNTSTLRCLVLILLDLGQLLLHPGIVQDLICMSWLTLYCIVLYCMEDNVWKVLVGWRVRNLHLTSSSPSSSSSPPLSPPPTPLPLRQPLLPLALPPLALEPLSLPLALLLLWLPPSLGEEGLGHVGFFSSRGGSFGRLLSFSVCSGPCRHLVPDSGSILISWCGRMSHLGAQCIRPTY